MNLEDIPSIQLARVKRAAMKLRAIEKAKAAWASATPNQKEGVRFGLNDINLIRSAGYDPYSKKGSDDADEQHEFILALMDCASADGGMRL